MSEDTEWSVANKPFTDTLTDSPTYVEQPSDHVDYKKLLGLHTDTLLDDLFLDGEQSLNGIPAGIQLCFTGLPKGGKGILGQEIVVRHAGDEKPTVLVTSEDIFSSDGLRRDLQSRLMEKCEILDINWDNVMNNLYILDAVKYSELRDWYTFATEYRRVVETNNVKLVLIDSLTLLEEYRGAIKHRLMELCRYNQKHDITAIYVNQRSVEEADKYGLAGGIGVAHNLDGTVIVDYTNAYHKWLCDDLGVKRGTFVRFIRVLGCRLCNFDRRYKEVVITDTGLLRLKEKS